MGRTHTPVYDFEISREMPAELDTVWRAWTDPEHHGAPMRTGGWHSRY